MNETAGTAPTSTASLQERVQSLRLGKQVRVPPRRSSKFFWLVILCIFVGGGAWMWMNYGNKFKEMMSTSTTPAGSSAPVPTKTEPEKEKTPSNVALEAGGYIVPFQKVQVSPKVGGQVKELFIEEGQFVKKGSILAKLETEEYDFDFRRAEAVAKLAEAKWTETKKGSREEELTQAEAAEKEANESLKQAKDELSKLQASGNAVTRDELDKAQSRVLIGIQKLAQQQAMNAMMKKGVRDERKDAAKAEYEQACTEMAKSKWRLDNCQVTAPIDGIILEKKTELGNTVRPEAFSNGLSANLCDMADLRNLEVEVDISERDIRQVRKGQKCLITTEAFKDKKYEGQVARIMPVASRSKASVTVRVKIDVPETERDLRPEMRARVQFLKDPSVPDKTTPVATSTAPVATPPIPPKN
ncbi:MAG: efflux RND transporter periplasmic adaptor subunit [Gemmatales bacterium]